MHVLAATNNLFPEPSATGSGRYNHEIGRRLADRGHRVSVITRRRGDAPERETVAGMDVRRYRASIPRLPRTFREIRRRVESIAADRPIDLVSFHGALSSAGVDRAVADRVPRAYTVHGLWAVEYRERAGDEDGRGSQSRLAAPWYRLNRALRRRVEAHVLDHADRGIVLSEFMRRRLRTHHPDAPPTTVVPGGVDADRFTPDAAAGRGADALPADDEIAFLTVRRLTRRMGIETLLDAFATVVAEGDGDVHLYVGGDGPLRDALAARARRLGVASSVTFLGYVPEDRLAGLYAAADAFVMPTVALEGFGLATLEALASGTPVIGTRAGATPEILAGLERDSAIPERLLVPAGDADALASAMTDWTGLSDDERTAAGTACRRYVVESGYTWERITDRIERLFEALA